MAEESTEEIVTVLADEWGINEDSFIDVCQSNASIRRRVDCLPDDDVDLQKLHRDVKSALLGNSDMIDATI